MAEDRWSSPARRPQALPGGDDPGVLEAILLAAVRIASLPFLLLVIVLASLIYGVAGLARSIGALTASASASRRAGGAGGPRDRPANARDA